MKSSTISRALHDDWDGSLLLLAPETKLLTHVHLYTSVADLEGVRGVHLVQMHPFDD